MPSPDPKKAIAAEAGAPSHTPVASTYVNPILDADFPDPAVIQAPDGHYYAYATQTLRDGEWINIQVARSSDLVYWEYLGDALPDKPSWARETQDFWAPSVIFDGATYFMYYSATHDACHDPERGHCLAVATSQRPPGRSSTWACRCCSAWASNLSTRWRSTILSTGKHWLYWGSGFQPIKVQELAADRMSFAPAARRSTSSGQIRSKAPSPGWSKPPGSSVTRTIFTCSIRGTIAADRTPNMA